MDEKTSESYRVDVPLSDYSKAMDRPDTVTTEDDFDDVAPDASSMIESMRAHGYTLATAIADLIDNSIAAGSRNVWLRFEWEGDDSWIAITDDGHGMTEEDLVGAMRLGSRSPLEARDPEDLGRFGLGLKTASFSQARRLTVISRQGGDTSLRRWDLDHLARPDVSGWQLLRSAHPQTGDRIEVLEGLSPSHGTQVLLEVLDRVTGVEDPGATQEEREKHFLWQINTVREHVGMVFHRFLEKKRGGLRIHLNDTAVEPWDPFLESHKATQAMGDYSQKLGAHPMPVRVKGFVMPHRDRFASSDQHRAGGGPGGWNAHQGFYLYRNERLIIAGDWLLLGWQQEEHFKLARIRLDISNAMDSEWQIDVKKSTAAPPAVLRSWLKGIAKDVRKRAKEVYSHRGKYGPRKKKARGQITPWVMVTKKSGEFGYRIERKHSVLSALIKSLSSRKSEKLEALLRIVEETVPVQRIWIDSAENQDGAAQPFAGENSITLRKLILLCHEALTEHAGVSSSASWDEMAESDGFQGDDAQAIIQQLREDSD
jgi:hypothetical protein